MNVDPTQFNPVALWRDWIVKSEAQWSEAMSGLLKHTRAGPLLKRQVDEARTLHRQFSEAALVALRGALEQQGSVRVARPPGTRAAPKKPKTS
jgi:hypothetical protein